MIIDCHGHYTTVPKPLRDYRQQQTDAPSGADQHCALSSRLGQDLCHRRTQRRSHLHLAPAAAGADEHQVGEIGARHQQHAADAREEQQHWQPRVPCDEVRERCHLLRKHRHPLPSADRQRGLTIGQLRTRLVDWHSRSQTADDSHEAADVFGAVNRQWKEQVDVRA